MRLLPFLLAALLALSPAATAGSPDSPEIQDEAGDAAAEALDIAKVWVDGSDPLNVTFHVVVPKLPAASATTGACQDPGCIALALGFTLEFTVLTPTGEPAPEVEGYGRTYAVYRHGAPAALRAAVGYYGADDELLLVGTASATVAEGGEIVLKVARNSTVVNLPAGLAPGAYRINQTLAHSAPQVCVPAPVGCTAAPRPAPSGTSVETTQWDTAPDAGFGRDYVFAEPAVAPGAPVPPASAPSSTAAAPQPSGPEPSPATAPSGSTTTAAPADASSPAAGGPGPGASAAAPSGSTTGKATTAPSVLLLLAGVAVALALRRRA